MNLFRIISVVVVLIQFISCTQREVLRPSLDVVRTEGGFVSGTLVPTDKPGFPNYGAFHTSEVPFALHTLALWDTPWQQSDYDVEKYMTAYWLNFVKTGNPNGQGLPEWKNYDVEEGVIMELGAKPEPAPGLYKAELNFLSLPLLLKDIN